MEDNKMLMKYVMLLSKLNKERDELKKKLNKLFQFLADNVDKEGEAITLLRLQDSFMVGYLLVLERRISLIKKEVDRLNNKVPEEIDKYKWYNLPNKPIGALNTVNGNILLDVLISAINNDSHEDKED